MANVRPHMNEYGPLPGSPYGYGPGNSSMMEAMEHARMGADSDHCGGICPYGSGMPPRSPYPPGFDQDPFAGTAGSGLDETIRRTNLAVQLANAQVSHSARYAQIQPKMCQDGRFPPDFRTAKTVEDVKVMDPTTLERILRAYGLPTDLRSLRLTSRDSVSTKTAHQAKLCTLFDFLGASRISEHERLKRSALTY